MTPQFLEQFYSLFKYSTDARSLVSDYLRMDHETGSLRDHLIILFSDLRGKAIRAVQAADLVAFNSQLSILDAILRNTDACRVLVATQKLVTKLDNPKSAMFAFQTDFLSPFFDLHPADFRNAFRFVTPDISTQATISQMHSQYIALMDGVAVTNVGLRSLSPSGPADVHSDLAAALQGREAHHLRVDDDTVSRRQRAAEVQPHLRTGDSVATISSCHLESDVC